MTSTGCTTSKATAEQIVEALEEGSRVAVVLNGLAVPLALIGGVPVLSGGSRGSAFVFAVRGFDPSAATISLGCSGEHEIVTEEA